MGRFAGIFDELRVDFRGALDDGVGIVHGYFVEIVVVDISVEKRREIVVGETVETQLLDHAVIEVAVEFGVVERVDYAGAGK